MEWANHSQPRLDLALSRVNLLREVRAFCAPIDRL